MTDIRDLLDAEGAAAEDMPDADIPMVRNRTSAKDPSQVYSLRLPVERIAEVRQLANEQHLAPTAMMRRWILERLDGELERRQSMESEPIYTLTRDQLGTLIEDILDERLKGRHRKFG